MKLTTFNIRCDCGKDGNNNFVYRKPLILDTIRRNMPEIICFQEVFPHVAEWLKEELREYVVLGCGRGADLYDEQMTVAFKKDAFNLIRMETYWMSETPYVPGSRYPEQSLCPRTCTELVLFENASGKVFRLINTHLDHEGVLARQLGLRQIMKKLENETFFAEVPVIVTGDFNAYPDSEEIREITEYPGFVDATKDIGTTWHDFMRHPDSAQIDYIFIKGNLACEGVEKWTDSCDGVYLSDHHPVCANLKLL